MIRRVAEAARKGIKLFVGHNKDNSHTNRPSVGQVLASYTRTVAGKMQALALTTLDGQMDKMDVCSIEADIEMSPTGLVGDITKLTGIAIGSSDKDSPAFPGARRMAQLQCFGETGEEKPLEKGENKMKVTFEDIKQGVRDMNIYPHQLFSEDDMRSDRTFGKLYTDLETANTNLKTATDRVSELEKESEDAKRVTAVSNAEKVFKTLIPENSTEAQKAFYSKRFNAESLQDLSEEGIKKHFEALQNEYPEYAKMFGVDTKAPEGGPNNEGGEKPSGEDTVSQAAKEIMGVKE